MHLHFCFVSFCSVFISSGRRRAVCVDEYTDWRPSSACICHHLLCLPSPTPPTAIYMHWGRGTLVQHPTDGFFYASLFFFVFFFALWCLFMGDTPIHHLQHQYLRAYCHTAHTLLLPLPFARLLAPTTATTASRKKALADVEEQSTSAVLFHFFSFISSPLAHCVCGRRCSSLVEQRDLQHTHTHTHDDLEMGVALSLCSISPSRSPSPKNDAARKQKLFWRFVCEPRNQTVPTSHAPHPSRWWATMCRARAEDCVRKTEVQSCIPSQLSKQLHPSPVWTTRKHVKMIHNTALCCQLGEVRPVL